MTDTITEIRSKKVAVTNVNGERCYYDSLNASGRGNLAACVAGPIEIIQQHGCDVAMLDGQVWALRDVLAMARRSERGLSVVEG